MSSRFYVLYCSTVSPDTQKCTLPFKAIYLEELWGYWAITLDWNTRMNFKIFLIFLKNVSICVCRLMSKGFCLHFHQQSTKKEKRTSYNMIFNFSVQEHYVFDVISGHLWTFWSMRIFLKVNILPDAYACSALSTLSMSERACLCMSQVVNCLQTQSVLSPSSQVSCFT